MSESLAEALPREIERVQDLIVIYMSVPMGYFAASLMKESIRQAHKAMTEGDVVGMLHAHEDLKGFTA